MKVRVLYDYWQMECCGRPFKVGDKISWLVKKNVHKKNYNYMPKDIYNQIGKYEYYYEAHSNEIDKILKIKGIVTSIKAIYLKYDKQVGRLMIPSTGIVIPIESTKDVEDIYDGMPETAYIVDLEDVTLRPALKEEVTFK